MQKRTKMPKLCRHEKEENARKRKKKEAACPVRGRRRCAVLGDVGAAGLREGARSALGARGGAGAAGPPPVGDLGHGHAVRGDVLPVLDELVAHLLHGVGAAVAELGQALDDVDDEVEAVELIEHAHVKRRRDRALLDVAADEHVLVVAGVRQLVDELRIAVEGEDDGLILREDEVVVLVREAVRVVGMRLQLHQVDHVHDAHAHLRQLLAQDGHGGASACRRSRP